MLSQLILSGLGLFVFFSLGFCLKEGSGCMLLFFVFFVGGGGGGA